MCNKTLQAPHLKSDMQATYIWQSCKMLKARWGYLNRLFPPEVFYEVFTDLTDGLVSKNAYINCLSVKTFMSNIGCMSAPVSLAYEALNKIL